MGGSKRNGSFERTCLCLYSAIIDRFAIPICCDPESLNCKILYLWSLQYTSRVYIQDHYAVAQSRPPLDSDVSVGGRDGDWVLVSGNYDGTWTILQFTRKLQTGDANGDRDIIEVCAFMCMYVTMHLL